MFSTEARALGSRCLSEYHGETWAYSDQEGRFISPSEQEKENAQLAAIASARADEQAIQEAEAEDRTAAKVEAAMLALTADVANRERVAKAVYEACLELLDDDHVSALTNALCVDSFLSNGLPQQ